MGYSGGTKVDPTYRSLGDHSETIEMDYDPGIISYEELLRIFWRSHDPGSPSWSRQYRSAVFYHNEEQRILAVKTRDEERTKRGGRIYTEIEPASKFYRAEDYHQKYHLRGKREVMMELRASYPGDRELVDATIAARLNGYAAGYGTLAGLEEESGAYALPPAVAEHLMKSAGGSGSQ